MKKAVSFYSERSKIAAELYQPDSIADGQKLPCVVLCHGFAGIKELLLPAYAEAFASAGYCALTFDYRGFGESEGERGRLVPKEQVRDIRNAITFAQSLPEVDPGRIALWGSSFGGANAVYAAAEDKRVRCITIQLTFADGEAVITGGQSPEEKEKLLAMLAKAWEREVKTNKIMSLPIEKVLTDPQSQVFFKKAVEEFPRLAVNVPLTTMKLTLETKPIDCIGGLGIPVHIVAAENDMVNPLKESQKLFEKAKNPKDLLVIKGAGHYEVYSGHFFKTCFESQLAWIKKYMA